MWLSKLVFAAALSEAASGVMQVVVELLSQMPLPPREDEV